MTSLTPQMFDAAHSELALIRRREQHRHDPVAWMEDYLGLRVWSKQKEIAYAVRDHRKTAVAAGHGVGKSFIAAAIMAWWIDTHPLGADETGAPQTFIASTAPFADQITAILWNNLRILHALSRARYERGEVDHPLPGYITGDNKWKTNDGLLIGQGRKPPDNKTDSGYQGLHATYLLAIGDEAAGLGADMVDALSNITTGQHNRMLLIANPTDPTSAMAKLWKNGVEGWHLMHISVLDSPRITGEPFPADRMTALSGQEYVDERRAEWGEDDPRYISRVLGQWAFDAGNNLFAETDLASAANTIVLADPDALPRHGWDIARMGGDHTVGYRMLPGEVWTTDENGEPVRATGKRGFMVRRIDTWSRAPLVGSDPANLGTAQRIDRHALGEGADLLVIDATGLGGGVVDGLRDLNLGKKYQVLEYYASGATTDRRSYTNARAQHYFALKSLMHGGKVDLDPTDTVLFEELRGIVYEYDTKGAKKIESKDDMRKRGMKSPDYADAVIYATADAEGLISNPLAGIEKGSIVSMNPWELLQASRDPSTGYPM